MKIKIKRLNENAVIPTQGSKYSAGLDLYSIDNGGILPGQTVVFGTGIAMEIPEGYFGGIFARSGLSTKQGLRPSTCVSVIDSDYRGEIMIGIHNDSDEPRIVSKGDRIAQMVILPYRVVEFEEGELTDTERGQGGFGSTGVNK